MASIRDIAKRAGTSVSAVSRAMNNTGYVSDTLRARIEAAVKELNYHPNAGARALRSGRSGLVGVLAPTLDVAFFAHLAQRIERRLFSEGYQAVICSTSEDVEHEAAYLRMLASKQVDGLLVAAVGGDGTGFRALSESGAPIVAIDRVLEGIDATFVGADHVAGGRMAADHVLSLGHRAIGVVGAPAHSAPVRLRAQGMRARLAEAGLDAPRQALGPIHSVDACEGLAETLLRGPDAPGAILATSDLAAIGVMRAARRLGLRLPQDLSVTGFDDIPAAQYVWPELTTIAQPVDALAERSVDLLIKKIKTRDASRQDDIILPVRLIPRGSTAPAR